MSREDDLKKLIREHQRRLQKLREQEASFGLHTPPHILTEIEDIEAKIEQLQAELAGQSSPAELQAERDKLQQTLANIAEMIEQGLPVAQAQREAEQRLAAIEGQLAKLLAQTATFDQRGQQVGTQFNIAGDLIQHVAGQAEPDPAPLRRAYLHRLRQQTRGLPLAGVDPKAVSDESSRELQLAAVYTALLTRRPEREDGPGRREIPDGPEAEVRHLPALALLNREPKLALLGDPGSGKSTFVNFVGLCLAGEGLDDIEANLTTLTAPLPVEDQREGEKQAEPQPWDHGPLLPVRIVLRDLAARGLPEPGQPAGGDTLWRFIAAELGETLGEYAPHLKRALQSEGGLILLDGLDEVPDAGQRRVQVKQAVQGFAADFPRCRFLVTSRTYAYQRQDWKLEGFAEAVLSPFTPGQIAGFVGNWYAHIALVRNLDADDAQGQATLLQTAIERSPRLAELASRPLLLTLMASLHAWRGGSLPERREELYADAVELLLHQWESPKVVRDSEGRPLVRQPSLAEWLKVERERVRAELNRLAFEAHRDQPQLVGTADIGQTRLVSALLAVTDNPEVNPVRLVEHMRDRAGLLAARGEGVYAFPHRTFQEYLAACHLTDEGFPDELAGLVKAEPQRWREAALLAGAKAARGTAAAVWDLAEALCYRPPPQSDRDEILEADCWGALLAAQTLLENERERLGRASERNQPKLGRIRDWLALIVGQGLLPPVDRALAGRCLAVLGDARDFETLVTVPAGPFLMGETGDKEASPQHELTLPEFQIGRYPVTNAQYGRFVEATDREWRGADRPAEQANCPATDVSWHEARAYCDWLTGLWRSEGRIGPDEVARLPSEAEWEKAARGPDGRRYPWGEAWAEARCNSSELGLGDPCVAGMFPEGASPYGCLDMSGNVWEWTLSLWGESFSTPTYGYPYDPRDGRENLEADDDVRRVLRGGSWGGGRDYTRCAVRDWYDPYNGYGDFGFRIVVSPISPSAL